jgi:hypothetical protein
MVFSACGLSASARPILDHIMFANERCSSVLAERYSLVIFHFPRLTFQGEAIVRTPRSLVSLGLLVAACLYSAATGQESKPQEAKPQSSAAPTAGLYPVFIDTTGSDWVTVGKEDFVKANCNDDTWVWDGNQVHCTGLPIGVLRSKKKYKNLEFVGSWRHLSEGGNSGFFLWTPEQALEKLPPNALPNAGIEVQVLDHGYTAQFEKSSGKKADWFSTNGDIFPVGKSKLKPFAPLSPDGSRSFPKSKHSLGSPQWNHYYVRAINGEVRLWVNGHEVSGGKEADPAEGYLCLESEGASVEFKDIKIRELP